jgi:hypothetical protein
MSGHDRSRPEFLVRQNERLITDVASLRDDMRVLTAIVMRLDNTRERHEGLLADMLREIQAMNARAARTDDRVRRRWKIQADKSAETAVGVAGGYEGRDP